MRVASRAAQVFGGIVLGLGLAEAGFYAFDGGAFPHLNLYVHDDVLGVRLLPGGSERIQFATNPTTTVRINAEGYRGADWGPPAKDEVVVLGDSQVFGLGVEEDETASAKLAATLGRPVRNAGVPTWGPPEFLLALDEHLAARKPKTVVIVINFVNDLFEVDTPNTQRHAVWDGWAVRLENAPPSVTDFPGRRWLMSQSHLMFGIRKALWTKPEDWGRGVASEGTWTKVVDAASSRPPPVDTKAEEVQVAATVTTAASQRAQVERDIAELYFQVFQGLQTADEGLALEAVVRRAIPGDIVDEHGAAEEARSVAVTAELLREGVKVRAGLEERLRKWAAENPKDKRAAAILDAVARREHLDTELGALSTRVSAVLDGRSPLEDFVRAARDRCDAAGAELLIAALPMDVQVSPDEWKKYGEQPQDMSSTRALLTDLVTGAERLGVRAVDLTDALAAAEPGAFLDADIHMTPKGQAAAADAIAARLAAPAPMAIPGPGLPPGRSRVPTPEELTLAPEVTVKGSTAAHCSTRQLREWLLVWCTPRYGDIKKDAEFYDYAYFEGQEIQPLGVRVNRGEEALTGYSKERYATLVTPLVPGHAVEADFWWTDRTERLTVTWQGDTPVMAFSPVTGVGAPPAPYTCAPKRTRYQSRYLDDSPQIWFGDATRGCDAYTDCAEQRDCAIGTRGHLPTCAEGEVNAGSAGHCRVLCDTTHPCASGACTDWQGGRVCL
jgi:hypothetical protein